MSRKTLASVPAPLWRRLAAAIYDFLLLAAIWMILAGVLVSLYGYSGLPMDDLNGIERPPQWFLQWVLLPLLLLATWAFFAISWMRGGCTLGMQAWRLRIRDASGNSLRLSQATVRVLAGTLSWLALGAGYLLVLLPPYQSFHDRVSNTETIME